MIDIWSSGIILFGMLCGYLPFEDKNNDRLYKKILEGKIELPSYLSERSKDLIKKLLTVNPSKRIKIDDIKNHQFFKISTRLVNAANMEANQIKQIDQDVVDKMAENGFSREEVILNLENNKLNNITTTYYLLIKKQNSSNNSFMYRSGALLGNYPSKEENSKKINININYLNKIENININLNDNTKINQTIHKYFRQSELARILEKVSNTIIII